MPKITLEMIETLKNQAVDTHKFNIDEAKKLSSDSQYISFVMGMTDETIRIKMSKLIYKMCNKSKPKITSQQAMERIYTLYVDSFSEVLTHEFFKVCDMDNSVY